MVDVKGGATLSIGGGWSASQIGNLLTDANWESGSSFGVNTSGGDVTTSASFTGLNLTKSGANTLYLAGGTVTNGSLVVSGGTLNASDPIVGTVSITVYGGAAAILSGNNTYSGGTTVGGSTYRREPRRAAKLERAGQAERDRCVDFGRGRRGFRLF